MSSLWDHFCLRLDSAYGAEAASSYVEAVASRLDPVENSFQSIVPILIKEAVKSGEDNIESFFIYSTELFRKEGEFLFDDKAISFFKVFYPNSNEEDVISSILTSDLVWDDDKKENYVSLNINDEKFILRSRKVILPDQSELFMIDDLTVFRKMQEGFLLTEKDTLESELKVKKLKEELDVSENNLIQASKLASIGELAAGIAHEINNPLSVILASVRVVKKFNEEESLRALDNISKSARRMGEIVKSVKRLTYSGKSALEVKEFSLNEIIEDAMIISHEKFLYNKVKVCYDEVEPDLVVKGSKSEITQVIINLINNAFDEVIKHENPWIKITGKRTEEGIVLSVIDSGPGVPKEIRQQIFQPFFTTKAEGKGTGLGLGISKKIMEKNKGRLQIDESALDSKFDMVFTSPNG